MKKLYVLTLLFYYTEGFRSQSNFNLEVLDTTEVSNALCVIQGQYYVYSEQRTGNPASHRLRKFNSSGQELFDISYLEGVSHVYLFRSMDNKIILSGRRNYNCELVSDTSKVRHFISKLDTNGNQVFYTEINLYPDNDWDHFTSIFQHSDSSYILTSQDKLIRISPQGQVLLKTNLGYGAVVSAIEGQNQKIMLFCTNTSSLNVYNLYESNLNGVSTWVKPLTDQVFIPRSYGQNGCFVALNGNGKLIRWSASFDVLASSGLTQGPTYFTDYDIQQDTLYLLSSFPGNNNVISYSYLRCDTNFNFFQTNLCNLDRVKPNTLRVSGSKTLILSDYVYQFGGIRNVVLSSIDKQGCINTSQDWLSINEVLTDTVFINYPAQSFPEMHLRLKVKVKNNGNSILNKIYLASGNWYNCNEGTYFKQSFTGLNILPGDSVWVTTQYLIKTISGNPGDGNVCLIAFKDNGVFDLPDNNWFCYNGLIFQGLNESNGEDMTELFPNPFHDKVTIRTQNEIIKLKLFNALGAILIEEASTGKEVSLETAELVNGFYFVEIKTERGIITKKLLKH